MVTSMRSGQAEQEHVGHAGSRGPDTVPDAAKEPGKRLLSTTACSKIHSVSFVLRRYALHDKLALPTNVLLVDRVLPPKSQACLVTKRLWRWGV